MSMDYLTLLIGFIVICFAVIVIAGFLETKMKKKREVPKDTPEEKTPEFTVGRIYQMEDGSFAKYAGDGKFLKVKK